jgi:hypothetical protein
MEFSKDMQKKLDEAYKSTTLPKSVNYEKVNALYHKLYEEYHNKTKGVVNHTPYVPNFYYEENKKYNTIPLENKFSM